MKQIVLWSALFLFSYSQVGAQEYSSAVGARLGYPLSASYKTFMGDSNNALELIAGFRSFSFYNWFTVGGAYQFHNEIESVDGLQWYYGFGASAYFWSFDTGFFGDTSVGTSVGIQGYIGLDYKFADNSIKSYCRLGSDVFCEWIWKRIRGRIWRLRCEVRHIGLGNKDKENLVNHQS